MAVVLGHEDGFDATAVGGEFEEVADGAVGGVKALIDAEASMMDFGAEAVAQLLGKGRRFFEIGNVALVERII
jgi:hypothetical protein